MRYKVHEFRYKQGMKGLLSEKKQKILEDFLNALEGKVVSIISVQDLPLLLIIEEFEV